MYVDFHMHSTFSDGTFTPDELYDLAKSIKLEKMALTDHNIIDGSVYLNKKYPQFCVKGVEIDCYYKGNNLHILAYNFDEKNEEFLNLVKYTNNELMKVDDFLINKLINEGKIERKDYDNFEKNPRLGGWKSLQYLLASNYVNDLNEYFKLHNTYIKEENLPKYKELSEVIEILHNANAKIVLAHPFKAVKNDPYRIIEEIATLGIDGIEVYYPSHTKENLIFLEHIVKKYNLFSTCGNDFHGTFQETSLGEQKINLNSYL